MRAHQRGRVALDFRFGVRTLEDVNDTLLGAEVRKARERLAKLGRWYASRPAGTDLAELERILADDRDLEKAARTARIDLVAHVERRAGPFGGRLLRALLDVPRERFVRPADVADSAVDAPFALDQAGLATISAPHAYLLSFRELGLSAGDRLVELGTGSGYGAALASHIVGPTGSVLTIEIDHQLAARAGRLLRSYANVRGLRADAAEVVLEWAGCERVTVTFAVRKLPSRWIEALPEKGRLIAPVGDTESQKLMLFERKNGVIHASDRGAVRYVPCRGAGLSGASP